MSTTVTLPRRIQSRRTAGWRLPNNTVDVSSPSRFGNPFTIKDAIDAEWPNPRSAVAANFGEWLRVGTKGGWYEETYRTGPQVFDRRRILADLHTLRGKDLACTCPLPGPGETDHCHAAVLLELANTAPTPATSESDDQRHIRVLRQQITDLRAQVRTAENDLRDLRERAAETAYHDLSTENAEMADKIRALPLIVDNT